MMIIIYFNPEQLQLSGVDFMRSIHFNHRTMLFYFQAQLLFYLNMLYCTVPVIQSTTECTGLKVRAHEYIMYRYLMASKTHVIRLDEKFTAYLETKIKNAFYTKNNNILVSTNLLKPSVREYKGYAIKGPIGSSDDRQKSVLQ